jgi:hypothetical protein
MQLSYVYFEMQIPNMTCHKTFRDRMPHHTHYAAPSTAASRTGTLHSPVFPVMVTELWTAVRETHCFIHCLGILRVVHTDV